MRFSYFDFKWTSSGRRRLKRLGVGQAHVTLSCRAARASIASFIDPCGVEDSALFPITLRGRRFALRSFCDGRF
jgi:hypothetical protein